MGVPPRGILQNHQPAVESTSAPPELCKWIFPTINYPQNNFTPNLHESLSILKPSKAGEMCHYGGKGEEEQDKESPPSSIQMPTFSRASGNLMQIQTSAQMQRIIAH